MTIWGKAVFSYRSLLHGEAAFSLLPMEGGAPKGRRLESPRYEREYEESGLSYRHPERSRGIFAIRGQGFTRSPHVPRTSPLFSSVFHPTRTLSGSLCSPPSPRGEGFIRRYSFSTYACIRFEAMGEAVFSYRIFPMGEGLRYGICFSFICFHARPGAFASCHPTVPFSRVQGRFLAALEMTIRGKRYSHFVDFPPSGSEWRLCVALLHASGVTP